MSPAAVNVDDVGSLPGSERSNDLGGVNTIGEGLQVDLYFGMLAFKARDKLDEGVVFRGIVVAPVRDYGLAVSA